MNKISAVIITYNEEKNIGRCIKSISDIADEIIVLDSFSTDKTEKICRQYNIKFFQHKFDGHIQQKNRAIDLASNKYVLSLDADEALSDTLKQSIQAVKKDLTKYDAYSFNRLTNYCGKWIKHGGWYPDTKIRLWNKEKGKWGGTNPHDKVIMENNSKIKHLKGDLLHYSYYSISQHIQQIDKFTTIGAKEVVAKGKTSSLFKAIYKSVWKFIRDYIIKLGFLDGYHGFVVYYLSAVATFIKYIKVKEYKKNSTSFLSSYSE